MRTSLSIIDVRNMVTNKINVLIMLHVAIDSETIALSNVLKMSRNAGIVKIEIINMN